MKKESENITQTPNPKDRKSEQKNKRKRGYETNGILKLKRLKIEKKCGMHWLAVVFSVATEIRGRNDSRFGDEFFSFLGDEGGKFASDDQEDKKRNKSHKTTDNCESHRITHKNTQGSIRFSQGTPGTMHNIEHRIRKSPERIIVCNKKHDISITTIQTFIHNSKAASADIKSMLESFSLSKHDLQEIMQLLVVASTLMDIIKTVEKISLSVQELAQKARFKKPKSPEKQQQLIHGGIISQRNDVADGNNCVVIQMHSKASELLENNNPRPLERNHEVRL
ncbi:hypothetical protein BUALT_Bualt09G0102600 [Buddleja alternifolia]|uniref:Uncharacterized protein n=1 Tax=Buddleja alternifolia TaxID=168488 RepID=A0AAV6XC37_9LAMI|nr:hypothetical protein BUALT_Bualt09G0102600 [Buddleja alternifolia]